ncbi:hypothetical protein [Iningainema tapete]|uniref:Uncharacterized protein n=1 Tax=Iningainema tapete BLCC-T55 TaxID=2748662 RepID=A0A8J7CHE8_9CYAN|nr:hypothetical protein [Iningainema tapete]MBD2777555.1 hypothetical protein [Iningainema tapete BLCC-T55]
MKEILAYFCLPSVAFAWFVLFLEREEARSQEKEKERREMEDAIEDYEEEMIKKIAELEIENEEMEKKNKAEEERAKNPIVKFFRITNNK